MRETLIDMLTYRRPMGSKTERTFRAKYLLNLPGARIDEYKNIHVQVGDALTRVLWSCHTDTVHREGGRQRLHVARSGVISLADPQSNAVKHVDAKTGKVLYRLRGDCLGADDTVGVYLMREMILAGRPGAYVFHHGEERGGIGSALLARHEAQWLARFDMAIALDRQGTGDIVTHQFGMRTASDTFAESLASEIARHDPGLHYAPSPGVYTDTAEYAEIIPECTNLSVGYKGQHTTCESVDARHVDRLLGALLSLDVSQCVIARDPQLYESEYGGRGLLVGDDWDMIDGVADHRVPSYSLAGKVDKPARRPSLVDALDDADATELDRMNVSPWWSKYRDTDYEY